MSDLTFNGGAYGICEILIHFSILVMNISKLILKY
jgi:hypothetical protein